MTLQASAARMPLSHTLLSAAGLLLLTCLAVLVHGYHLGVDDGAIYLPAVKRIFNPALYPFGSEFFLSHAHLSIFALVVGKSALLLHLPIDLVIFLWHVACLFLFVLAAKRIADLCFAGTFARWSAVTLVALLASVPAAGTALVLMDPYLTARSISTPCSMFAIASFLAGRRFGTLVWLLLTASVHPQMAVYAVGLMLFLALAARWPAVSSSTHLNAVGALPAGLQLKPAQGEYANILHSRTFFFAGQWAWYEWVGAIAPLCILIWLSRLSPRGALPSFRRLARALVPFGLISILVFLLLNSTPNLESFTRLQPMRSFQLIYIFFFILIGGLLGEYLFERRVWLAAACFVAIGAGMTISARSAYPASRHIEWPLTTESNPWLRAFFWIRQNTPQDAVFALDPGYMAAPGEDQHGFRAVAERSVLADAIKDSGAVTMFPRLTAEWVHQQQMQSAWPYSEPAARGQLRRAGVSWIVLQTPPPAGLNCPYSEAGISVCRLPPPG